MSARDSESGSSSYKGGSRSAGGLGNGGIGGGRGGGGNFGGGMGGGAGRNGGIGSRTGLTTGTKMVGTPGRDGLSATGRPGGMAQNPGAWGMRPQSSIARGTLGAPAAPAVPGLLAEPVPAAVTEEIPAYTPNPFYQGVPPPAQYSSIYKNRIAELLNAQRPPIDPRDYSNIYGGAGRAPLNIGGAVGGGGIPGYSTSRGDPNYRALGSGQTSINGVMGGFGSQGTPGAGSRRY